MPSTTCIRNAACIVAWDATNRRHAYLMGGDVAFTGETLSYHRQALRRRGGRNDRRHRPDGDAGPDRSACPSQHGAVLSRRARGARRARDVYERLVRTLGRVAAGCRRAQGRQAGGVLRDAAVRHHQRRRSVGHRRGLDRSRGAERPARVPGTLLRLCALAPGERLGAEIPLGRGGRPSRTRCSAGADRAGGRASVRPPVGHRLAGADRHLHDRSAARQLRRGRGARRAADRALRAERQRVPGHGRSPRQVAGPVRARPRHPVAAHRAGARDVHRRAFVGALAYPHRSRELWSIPAPASRIARRRSRATATRWRISAAIIAPASISASARTSPRTTSSRRCGWPRSWRAWRRATSPRPASPRCSMPRRWVARTRSGDPISAA